MDTTRDILYRSFLLNDSAVTDNVTGGGGIGTGITGSVVDSFDLSDVDVIQWNEKRSQADGNDAGDVFQGMRRIRLSGTLYALTRPLLFDALLNLRAALNPVLAQREEPLDHGYRPLYFSVPTNRVVDYPSGAIDLLVYAMPRAFQQVTNDDQIGREDYESLAVPWQATLLCRDPGIYGVDAIDITIPANATTVSGTWNNRGTYLGVLNAVIEVGSASGTIAATLGDSVFTIAVPASTGNRIIRIKGSDKMLTFEEGSVETPQMSRITFTGDTTWPLISPGATPYSITFTGMGGTKTGSHMWFYEQYA